MGADARWAEILERKGLIDARPATVTAPAIDFARFAPNPTEAEFTLEVIDLARLYGWRSAHFRPGMNARGEWRTAVAGDGVGFPDLLLIRHRVIVAELKVGRNKTTREQDEWIAAFRRAGVPAFVWTPKDWPLIETTLSAPAP